MLRFLLRRSTQPLIFPMILKSVQLLAGELTSGPSVSPRRGLRIAMRDDRGLTPPAKICRRAAAKEGGLTRNQVLRNGGMKELCPLFSLFSALV